MRRFLLSLFVLMAAITVSAQDPILTLKANVGDNVSLSFGVYDTEDTYSVDFGDGVKISKTVGIEKAGPVQPDTSTGPVTVFSGTVAGDGTIKVYGNNDIYYFIAEGAIPTSFDQPKLANVTDMSISGADVESLVLPAFDKLTQFKFTNSPVKSVDISKATALVGLSIFNTTLSAFEPQLKTLDISKNVNLETIVLGSSAYKKSELTKLDVSKNTKLTQISAENCKLTAVTGIAPTVKNIYLSSNELSSLTFPEFTVKGTIQIHNNKFTLATLPKKPAITTTSKYKYAPQAPIAEPNSVNEIDLSSQLKAYGISDDEQTTTFSFETAGGTALVENTDYQATADGKFKFLTTQGDKVHAVLTTAAFPKFTGADALKTTDFTVSAMPAVLALTTTDEAWGGNLKLVATETGKTFSADMGDGNIVAVAGGTISGPALGEGNIIIYSDGDLKTVTASKVPMKSIDFSKATKMTSLSLTQVGLKTVDVTPLTDLTDLTFSQNPVTSMNLTKNTKLTTLKMVNTNANVGASAMKSIDLSKNADLKTLWIYGKSGLEGALENISLSSNKKLEQVYLQFNKLKSMTLGDNNITMLNVQGNQLKSLDFTKLTKATDVYAQDNQLEGTADLSKNTVLKRVRVDNNKLSGLKVGDVSDQLYFYNNNMNFATMPELPSGMVEKVAQFKYAPQYPMEVKAGEKSYVKNAVADKVVKGVQYDLSDQLETSGINRSPVRTEYSWHTQTGAILTVDEDYLEKDGVFTFLTAPKDSVFCVMRSIAFPDLISSNGLQTELVKIVAEKGDELLPVVTMTSTVDGESERTLQFGTYKADGSIIAVDWGDGIVKTDSVCTRNSELSKYPVKGIAKGEGRITVYACDSVWYFATSGGSQLKDLDLTNIPYVQQMSITGVGLETIDVSKCDSLRVLSFNNNPTKTLDLSKNPKLSSLTVNATTASKYESQLESIDLSNNPELTYLSLQGNQNTAGKLTTVDLTANTKLESLFLQYNALTEVKLGDNAITLLNVQNNQLATLDLTKLPKLKNLYASDNKLTALDFSALQAGGDINIYNNELTAVDIPVTVKTVSAQNNKITAVSLAGVSGSNCKFENNCLTLATIPAQPEGMNTANKTKKFTYAPQADLQVSEDLNTLDLSAQLTVAKGELNPEGFTEWLSGTTTYTVKTAAGTALTEGTDYSIEGGVITFMKNQTEKVYVEMLNAALPKFTADAPFKTTAFTVSNANAIRNAKVSANDGKIYNLKGVEVKNPTKGLYIQNGKVIMK